LTYGGWLQSKALGARIASILQDREAQDDAARAAAAAVAATREGLDGEPPRPKKKRRYNVVIHTSPFLRCIQTSVAISAGLASNPPGTSDPASDDLQSRPRHSSHGSITQTPSSPMTRPRPAISTDVPPMHTDTSQGIQKLILRLDPFLGEWASPDYFEHITPPPKSSLMLMTAKAELLKKENYNSYPHFKARTVASTPSQQLWKSPTLKSFDSLPKMADSLPGSRSDSPSGGQSSMSDLTVPTGYMAPIPPYAVSPSGPIPAGYVAHARDACVDIDYQWDSTREPIVWGEGGELPEEWAAMHQRFRRGLKRLVDWYTYSEKPGQMVTKTPTTPESSSDTDGSSAGDDDNVEVENVVVLVSHGAGCNALTGGITNQPVLADVAMSSLTVARRRSELDNVLSFSGERKAVSLDDALSRVKPEIPDLYELVMFANTDHLLALSRSSSVSSASARERPSSGYRALKDIGLGVRYGQARDHRSHSVNASLGSIRRSPGVPSAVRPPSIISSGGVKGGITVGSGITGFGGGAGRKSSWGLWTPKQQPQDPEEDLDLPMTLDFSHEKDAKKPTEVVQEISGDAADYTLARTTTHESEEHDHFDTNGFPSFSSGSGLWGSPRPPDDAEVLRDFSSTKRRWTVNER
jgi:hypothetical protein